MASGSVLARLSALEVFGIKLGLTNIARLCEALDHPERAFRSVHIAGTNGKGSVTAMVHAGLLAAGIPTARYTSPHLVDLAERFVIGTGPVTPALLEARGTVVLDMADALVRRGVLPAPPTFFEATTAIAFDLFRTAGVEVAVVEVGLGGRWDATNIVQPAVTAITAVGMDHQQQLGSTLAAIAGEKAGIIKPGVPVVLGPLVPEAESVVRRVAAESAAPVVGAYDDVALGIAHREGRTALRLRTPAHDYGTVVAGLRGDHQIDNALVAVRVLETLGVQGVNLTPASIAAGVAEVRWPGRLEWLELDAGGALLLDAAHNPDGAAVLARYLARWHPERPPLVFGAMRDKDVTGILQVLLPLVGPVIVTAPATSRALEPQALADAVRDLAPGRFVVTEADPVAAVRRALSQGPLACVAGSIFLVGAVREAFIERAILK